ncbi:MAG TPA: nitric-oxide reductase large subunit [Enhygromyxa sp.]|nr:nitric-oxide reductase large subunit [Enhygromyxa sp.]
MTANVRIKQLWIAFAAVLAISFAVLGWAGVRIYQMAPPVPDRVVTDSGRVIFDSGAVQAGQNVWRALGGMEVGSVWGHGGYVAPDWTADWLHREASAMLDARAQAEHGQTFAALSEEQQAALRAGLIREYRHNGYDATSGTLVISEQRAHAIEATAAHIAEVFRDGREAYAMPADTLSDPDRLHELSAFFFWTAWAAATLRPGDDVTYTSNWPHEPLIDNRPSPDAVVWTGVSILMLLAGIGAMAFWHATQRSEAETNVLPPSDPLIGTVATRSQLATIKYFWVVCGLLLAQVVFGVITAHYGVEGTRFYGVPLAELLPYSIARTWHVQLGILWIATAWLGAGLVIAPSVGEEPRGQAALVNLLFVALLVVVVGSMIGQWLSVRGALDGDAWWWFGHSGYEYIDLGRSFQLGLMVGLVLWAYLVARALWPALRQRDDRRPLLILLLISTLAIAGFYFAALGAGRHTNLAIAEYWRWWVVHLWVEGFFEVFATAVIAFLFVRLGLVGAALAGRVTVLAATIFLSGGVIGTLHHLYFSGTPTFVLALGAVFSALEVVPLVFLGKDAWDNWQLSGKTEWMRSYRWPVFFFIGVAFWNLIGAGLFGFMINPPIALYYMQGLNTTPVHGHTALFGVYGLLGMGLVLFAVRAVRPHVELPARLLRFSFWTINGGLAAMVLLSVLPVGLLQTWASVEHGYWYARSPEFLQSGVMDTLRWLRVIGDTIFAIGVFAFVLAILRATIGRRGAVELSSPD